MEGLQAITRMGRLQICNMNLSYPGIHSLEGLRQMLGGLTHLQELSLNLRGCKGLADTAGLENLNSLRQLKKFDISLRYTAITN
eukprot:15703791-Heterocapsa_arctica.AAC.1